MLLQGDDGSALLGRQVGDTGFDFPAPGGALFVGDGWELGCHRIAPLG